MMNATTAQQATANAAVDSRSDAAAMKVYLYIVSYKQKHDGCAPSVRQIAEAARVSSTSMVQFYLAALEDRHLIRRSSDEDGVTSRGIEVVGAKWMPPGERA